MNCECAEAGQRGSLTRRLPPVPCASESRSWTNRRRPGVRASVPDKRSRCTAVWATVYVGSLEVGVMEELLVDAGPNVVLEIQPALSGDTHRVELRRHEAERLTAALRFAARGE